jgi:hypothetical protein
MNRPAKDLTFFFKRIGWFSFFSYPVVFCCLLLVSFGLFVPAFWIESNETLIRAAFSVRATLLWISPSFDIYAHARGTKAPVAALVDHALLWICYFVVNFYNLLFAIYCFINRATMPKPRLQFATLQFLAQIFACMVLVLAGMYLLTLLPNPPQIGRGSSDVNSRIFRGFIGATTILMAHGSSLVFFLAYPIKLFALLNEVKK